MVLRYVAQARARGLGVIFITHNVHHAYPVGDAFTILNRGRTYGTFQKDEVSREEVLNMMAGGKELEELSAELEEFARADTGGSSKFDAAAAAEHAMAETLHEEAELPRQALSGVRQLTRSTPPYALTDASRPEVPPPGGAQLKWRPPLAATVWPVM